MKCISNRMTAFLIKSRLDYSICDLCRYLDNEHKVIDCLDIKKNYVLLNPNGCTLKNVLINYVIDKINNSVDKDNQIPDDVDIKKIVANNLDIFFELSDNDGESIFVECAEM